MMKDEQETENGVIWNHKEKGVKFSVVTSAWSSTC